MALESQPPKPKLGPPIDIIEVALFGPGRYRLWLVPCALIGLVIGFGMALLKKDAYSSTAKIYITWGEREQWNAEKLIKGAGGGMGGGRSAKGGGGGFGMQKELQFLKNGEFFERIAREVGPERLFEPFDPLRHDTPSTPRFTRWQHLAQDWYFNRGRRREPGGSSGPDLDLDTQVGVAQARAIITNSLRMRPAGANVLQIAYSARSPELAQDVVQAAVKVTMQRHFEIFDERFNPEFVSALRDQADYENKLASEEFFKHQQDCGFYDITRERGQLTRKQMVLEEKLEYTATRLEEIQREKEYLQDQLALTPEEALVEFEPIEQMNPVFVQLDAKLRKLLDDVAQLELTFKPGSPAYESKKEVLDTQIARLEEQLAETDPRALRGRDLEYMDRNPEYDRILRKLDQLEFEKDKLLIGQTRTQERLEGMKDTLAAIMACEPLHAEMRTTIAKSRQSAGQFQRALDKREAAKILDVDESMGNIWVMQQPSYSPVKVSARRSETVLMGLGIGFGVGVGLAILRQLLDQRLRYPFAVQRILGAPVLGVVPEERAWRKLTRQMKKQEAAAGA